MNNMIELKKSNGETIKADLICYFKVLSTQKKYIFYTQNEIVENGLIKMYVSEVFSDASGLNINAQITDTEWQSLKAIMKTILTGTVNNDIEFLSREES